MANDGKPSARIEALGDTGWVDGVFDITADFDAIAPYDYGSTDDSTARPAHVGANSPADPTFDAHAANGFLPGFPNGD